MVFVVPDYVYTILLACVMGACSTEEDPAGTAPTCVCKPSMYVDQIQVPANPLDHHICNNATFDWLLHTMLAEMSTQKEAIASSKEVIHNLQVEVEAYEHNHATLNEKNHDLQEEIEWLLSERSKLTEKIASLNSNVITLEEELDTLRKAQRKVSFPRDCADIQIRGSHFSGLYTIYPAGIEEGLEVFCDLNTDGGGWTVVQRRVDGSQKFDLDWEEYKKGFGKPGRELWLGNENIHLMTEDQTYELRVELVEQDGRKTYAIFNSIRVEDEASDYTLRMGAYTQGNAGDAMSNHDGMKFSTIDVDNDLSRSGHCSKLYGNGGWWFARCYDSNLNGMYAEGVSKQGIVWFQLEHDHVSLKHTEMKIRPQYFNKRDA